jgi:OOP family OmpA-OmpF porin
MKFRNALVSATMLALPIAASAQPITGIYIGADAGANIMSAEHVTITGAAPGSLGSVTGDIKTHFGPAGGMSLGYGFGNGLRAEVEGVVRSNDINGINNGTLQRAGGQELKYGPMFNVLYDFVDLTPYLQPYIGAGVGYQWVQDKNFHAITPAGALVSGTNTKGDFAYQGIVGAAFPVASAPGLAFTIDYRFMDVTGNRNFTRSFVGAGGARTGVNISYSHDLNNTALIGIRYNFGVAPPPVPIPAPAVVAPSPISRSYLVFFDWDKADLTDRARQIVSEAAANSTKVQYTRLEVNGYTDTSGTPKYNQGLSVRRAKAVAAELVKDGVPTSAISIQGFGETHLLVPTGPGVREPQNRRVEIIIK